MQTLGTLLLWAIDIYTFIIIAHVIVSWLVAFGVLNLGNPQAANLVRLIQKATDPVMQPVQRFIPAVGGIDFSPIIVIFGLILLKNLVADLFFSSPAMVM